jgi:transposase
VLPSWLTEPLWDQFAALLPQRPTFDPAHPLGCHRSRISDRIVFGKLLQVLRFGCSYEAIADSTCLLVERGLRSQIATKGIKAPVQTTQRWHIERTHAWQNAFHRLARCYERRGTVIDAFFDLVGTIITARSIIRRAWVTHRWDTRRPRGR